ncbi:hypothetical protein JCM10295v2_000516 [Rhodotorula toruloides]
MTTQDLTLRMIVSSMFGWLALATTCAVWTPLIIMNAARLRVSASPRFIYIYLFGDFTNLLGVILGKLPPTQLALGIWHVTTDCILLVQLSFFGHLDPFAPDPQPTRAFNKLRERKKKHPRWYKVTVAFMSFSLWDDVKLLLFCIAAGLAAGGIYLTLGLYQDPEHFAIEVPHVLDLKSFILGLVAQSTVCLARIPELRSGESPSKAANIRPEHAVDDPLFWFLIAENSFNLLSISILSQESRYLLVQSPWTGGGALMILLDSVLISRIGAWQKRWRARMGVDGETRAPKDTERAARLAELDEEKAKLEEEWAVQDMHVEAYGPAPKQNEGESNKQYKRRLHAHAVTRKDYLKNQHLVADVKERGNRRAGRREKRDDLEEPENTRRSPVIPDLGESRRRLDLSLPSHTRHDVLIAGEQDATTRDFLLRPRSNASRRQYSSSIARRTDRTKRR